jgi:hypothetical protein
MKAFKKDNCGLLFVLLQTRTKISDTKIDFTLQLTGSRFYELLVARVDVNAGDVVSNLCNLRRQIAPPSAQLNNARAGIDPMKCFDRARLHYQLVCHRHGAFDTIRKGILNITRHIKFEVFVI